ncbi:hypothetical protein D3C76_1091830 [compost metagenome]
MGHRHIARREAEFDVVQAVACGILNIFEGDPTAGVQRGQDFYPPVELAQEADQIRLVFRHLHVWDQCLKGLCGQG